MTLADRYARVKASLPPQVKLIAVSKTRTVAEIQALYDLGQRAFGENYPQELRDKQPLLPADIEWHFIGHFQSNKVKYIAPFVHLVHAVDSTSLLDELEKRAAAAGRTIGFLWQARIAREETKHGLPIDELSTMIQRSAGSTRWPHLVARGLMGMASNTDDTAQVDREFAALAELFRTLRASGFVDPERFTELSMGMSSDLRQAITHGSTMVRIGTAIFGERSRT